MNEGCKKLQDIGVQKIHETTHITRVHIQAILDENFASLSSVQFLGFVSILEKEYCIDLTELKNNGLAYFEENTPEVKEEKSRDFFVKPKRKRKLTIFFIIIGLLIFLTFAYLNTVSTNSEILKDIEVDNSAIENAKNNLSTVEEDTNSSTVKEVDENSSVIKTDTNSSAVKVDANSSNASVKKEESGLKEIKESKEIEEISSFKIIPINKVWLGYIDLSTYKKYQKTFIDEFDLDPAKDWLLVFGHGNITIEVNGIIKKFANKKGIRFSYINGELKEITLKEFKSLNRGNRW